MEAPLAEVLACFLITLIVEEPDKILDPHEMSLPSHGSDEEIDPPTLFDFGEVEWHYATIPSTHI